MTLSAEILDRAAHLIEAHRLTTGYCYPGVRGNCIGLVGAIDAAGAQLDESHSGSATKQAIQAMLDELELDSEDGLTAWSDGQIRRLGRGAATGAVTQALHDAAEAIR
jgi:hypothetical protein